MLRANRNPAAQAPLALVQQPPVIDLEAEGRVYLKYTITSSVLLSLFIATMVVLLKEFGHPRRSKSDDPTSVTLPPVEYSYNINPENISLCLYNNGRPATEIFSIWFDTNSKISSAPTGELFPQGARYSQQQLRNEYFSTIYLSLTMPTAAQRCLTYQVTDTIGVLPELGYVNSIMLNHGYSAISILSECKSCTDPVPGYYLASDGFSYSTNQINYNALQFDASGNIFSTNRNGIYAIPKLGQFSLKYRNYLNASFVLRGNDSLSLPHIVNNSDISWQFIWNMIQLVYQHDFTGVVIDLHSSLSASCQNSLSISSLVGMMDQFRNRTEGHIKNFFQVALPAAHDFIRCAPLKTWCELAKHTTYLLIQIDDTKLINSSFNTFLQMPCIPKEKIIMSMSFNNSDALNKVKQYRNQIGGVNLLDRSDEFIIPIKEILLGRQSFWVKSISSDTEQQPNEGKTHTKYFPASLTRSKKI